MSTIRIAGIDPSLRNTGIALADFNLHSGDWKVDRVAIIQTQSEAGKTVRRNSDDYRCARELINGTNRILKQEDVRFVFAELPTGAQSARAAFAFGMTTAIMAGLLPPLIQVLPREVQIAVLGKAGKDKGSIIKWAMGMWPDAGWLTTKRAGKMVPTLANEHPADACAAIAAGVQTPQFAQAMALAAGLRAA